MHPTSRPRFHWLLSLTACGVWLPFSATAQPAYGKVLEVTPIYEQVATPQEHCTEFSTYRRCTNTTTYEEVVSGYHVLYEYQGQQYTQRMAHHPGQRIPIQTAPPGSSYSSTNSTSGSATIPGQQSWSSTMPGAPMVDSIQYQGTNEDVPVNIDLHLGRPGPRR